MAVFVWSINADDSAAPPVARMAMGNSYRKGGPPSHLGANFFFFNAGAEPGAQRGEPHRPAPVAATAGRRHSGREELGRRFPLQRRAFQGSSPTRAIRMPTSMPPPIREQK